MSALSDTSVPPELEPLIALADDHLVLGQRTAERTGANPSLEEELAMANLGLDLIGQARALYAEIAKREGAGRTEDDLAFLRPEHRYLNLLLVEQPNEDFAHTVTKNLLFSAFMTPYWDAATGSTDQEISGIAQQAVKESTHHRRHAAEWVIRLGDGTAESRARMIDALETLWPFCGELFEVTPAERAAVESGRLPDRASLRAPWEAAVTEVLRRATLEVPRAPMHQSGGRHGRHTEAMGHLLAALQHLPLSHSGAVW